jgi:hypothetical protein
LENPAVKEMPVVGVEKLTPEWYFKAEYLITVKDLAQEDQQTDLVKAAEVMAAEAAASDTLWFMLELVVMALC